MNAGAVTERVEDAIRRRIRARAFRPGERLDPALLAAELSSSVTPVRDALHRLTGEGLVASRASEGFHLPHIDAPALQDLYEWHADVLALVIRRWRAAGAIMDIARATEEVAPDPAAIADLTEAAFLAIVRRSGNVEHRQVIAAISDRLRAARLVEPRVLAETGQELTALQDAVARGVAAEVRTIIATYHRRRHRQAADIVRILYRNGER